MKKIVTILIMFLSLSSLAYEKSNEFFFEPALNFQFSTLTGYKISSELRSTGLGLSLRTGYNYKIIHTFYVQPVVHLNLIYNNTFNGVSSVSKNTYDLLKLSNPFGATLRFGGLKINNTGFEFLVGAETTNYVVTDEFATFASKTKSDDVSSTNLVLGFRILGLKNNNGVFKDLVYSLEFLTKSASFRPLKNVGDTWDIRTSSINFAYHF
tara:strand:- start:1846 stop:2475 length:630 start_codon:yes stop_codon:yes gene_type:complete